MTVNLPQLRTLVAAQLRLDLRHPKSGTTSASRLVLTVTSYAFSSLVLALSLAERGAAPAEFLFAGLSFSVVLAAFGVTGSYDDLMGRPRDNAAGMIFPISEPTLYLARLSNVGIFSAVMGASAALPLALVAGFNEGPAWGWTLGIGLFTGMMAITAVVLAVVWMLVLILAPRTLRAILSAMKALLVGGIVLGYQWVALQPTLIIEAVWWPPYWVLLAWSGSPAATAALVGVGLLIVLTYGLVFPRKYLPLLKRSADAVSAPDSGRRRSRPRLLDRGMSANPSGRAGFGLAVAAIRGDRVVRGRVWPAALLALVFAAFAWWSGGLGDIFVYGAENVLFDPAIQMHLSVLTVLLFTAQAAAQGLQVSETPEAGWAFEVLPVRDMRALRMGAQRALLVHVLLPLHAVLFVLLAMNMPVVHAALHVGFWLASCAVLTGLQLSFGRRPPLSRRSDRFSAGERFLPLIVAAPVALVLLFLQSVAFTNAVSASLLILGLFVLHAALARTNPHQGVETWKQGTVKGDVRGEFAVAGRA